MWQTRADRQPLADQLQWTILSLYEFVGEAALFDAKHGNCIGSVCGLLLFVTVLVLAVVWRISLSDDMGTPGNVETWPYVDLVFPRGSVVARDGTVIVADSGVGTYPASGALLKLDQDGNRTSILEGPEYFGIADVAILDDDLYFVVGSQSGFHYAGDDTSVLQRYDANGTTSTVFDLGAFEIESNPDQRHIGSNASGMAVDHDGFIWVSDGAGNWLARISVRGALDSIITFPAVDDEESVPTGVAVDPSGDVYVTLFRCQGPTEGKGGVAMVQSIGDYEIAVTGLNTPIDVAFDPRGVMYVLEFSDNYRPDSGRLMRIGDDGERKILIDSLEFPTSLSIDEDGRFAYIAESVGMEMQQSVKGRLLRFALPTQ